MRLNRLLLVLSLTLSAGSFAAAQKDLPKVHSLGQAVDSIPLGFPSNPSVRVLSNGRLLAIDLFSRRLIMVSEDMKKLDTLFDANSPAPLTYGSGYSQLIAAGGDSTLFVDAATRGYRVIDEAGHVVRRLSIRDQSLTMGLQSPATATAVDPNGRLVVVGQRWGMTPKRILGLQPQAESLMMARVDLERMGFDSITAIMGSGQRTFVVDSTTQSPTLGLLTSVVDLGDAWTVTPTGTIAIVRASDFHVEWIESDGSRRHSPPVPWTWTTYSRAERESLKAAREGMMSSGISRVVRSDGQVSTPRAMPQERVDTVPERAPAFTPSNIRADRDGRIWLQLGPKVASGMPSTAPTVFAIIDKSGQIVDRVELPPRRVLVGFDQRGYVYTVVPVRGGVLAERYLNRKP